MKKTSSCYRIISTSSQVSSSHLNNFDEKEKPTENKEVKLVTGNLLVAMLTRGLTSEESQGFKNLTEIMPYLHDTTLA